MEKFEEYKFFAESTQYLSERRQAATQTYLSVNTAIFAVFAFLIKDYGIDQERFIIFTLPLFLVGIVACWIWHRIIIQYKGLIGWRYDQLMEIERQIENSHQMYIQEWEKYFKPIKGKEKFGFSKLEHLLPIMFMVLYLIYGIGLFIYFLLC